MSLTNQQQADEHFMRLALGGRRSPYRRRHRLPQSGHRPCSQPNRDFA